MSKLSVITITTSRGGRAEIDIDNLRQTLMGVIEDAEGIADDAGDDQSDKIVELEGHIEELEGDGSLIEHAAAEIRYGNLDEALVYIARAIPALDGLPHLVAKELARREARRAEA
ncbi:hypothetical protein [Camelimonas lactis]|uniref:Uncharacterized protein n=1 Tax=Camelimonas lactis TaxID=659006 RepID=A0A4R2GXB7_9HYPH|nr:hypothetical protein [Camelimonas lactis]TCO15850.1 hypothetical protein EV666_10199 [Camelimonas lactis]